MRYLLNGYVQAQLKSVHFPIGTLVVNVVGCLIIGFLSYVAESRGIFDSPARSFVFVGVLGGFTTFSTFSNETMNFMRGGETVSALANVGLHVVLGLGAVWLGRMLGSWLLK
jgi:CrcB protein